MSSTKAPPSEARPDLGRAERIVYDLLGELGEDPEREGLRKTPERVMRALEFLTAGYRQDVDDLFNGAFFEEDYDEMVVVRDIEFYSLCVPSNQIVNAVGGARRAAKIRVGDRLWTLKDGLTRQTTVTAVGRRQTRKLVEVVSDEGIFRVTPDHPFATREGWVEAADLEGHMVEWTRPKALCRHRYPPRPGYAMGFAIGAVTSDGTIGRRSVSLVVNSRTFAERFASSMRDAFGVESQVERWNRPGWYGKHGFRQRDHRSSLVESCYVPVRSVRPVRATGKKPFTVYSFKCEPHPTFLVAGHLSHNCEHHLLPFFGKAHVAYIPDGRIVGLSKIPRLVDLYARRLQVQERMTKQIGETMMEKLNPLGAAVVVEARHLCMVMRGVEKQHSHMTTSHMLGCFREEQSTRMEFMNLIAPRSR